MSPPSTTAMGALLAHITSGADAQTFQPMNVNFGLFPDLNLRDARGRPIKGRDRKAKLSERALADIQPWASGRRAVAAE